MVAVLLLLLDFVKYIRMRARACVRHAPIPPRAHVYDLNMLLLPPPPPPPLLLLTMMTTMMMMSRNLAEEGAQRKLT